MQIQKKEEQLLCENLKFPKTKTDDKIVPTTND